MESSSETTYSSGHEVYIKEEPWCPGEMPIAVKCEETPVSNNGLQKEMVSVSSDNTTESKNRVAICSDNEIPIKVEVKEELHWPETSSAEISCKSEYPSDSDIDLQNETEQTDSHSDKIRGDLTAEAPRLYTESVCVNDNGVFRATIGKQDSIKMGIGEKNCERISTCETLTRHSKGPYKCEVCEKSFRWFARLKIHNLMHEGKKSYQCETCGSEFLHESVLNRHKSIHVRIRAYKCDLCGKAFKRLSDLKKHNLIHEGKRLHSCKICGMSFTQASSLKIHNLSREGIRPHTCDICKQSFTRLSSLKRHKLVHGGSRPYKCEICEKSYFLPSQLKRHKLFHEDNSSEACEILRNALLKP